MARRRRWRLVDVRPFEDCTVVRLASTGGDSRIDEQHLIAPFDTIERVQRSSRARLVGVRYWRAALRSAVAAAVPPGGLRTAHTARIELLEHQLEPALAVVRGLGTRVLLADDVGLGKTIQAGLILSELRARTAADRILIVTPAGLRDQWADELSRRFDVAALVLDAGTLRRRRSELAVGLNPWSTIPVGIVSVDYVKRPEILRSASASHWDVLVVDEAHNVTGETDRHAAIAVLASRAPYVLLLTATPHSGDRRAFASLCNIGAHDDRLLVFRRSRSDVGPSSRRRVRLLSVRQSSAERRMHELLDEIGRKATKIVSCDPEGGSDVWLTLAVLNKRAFSSAHSLLRTIERRMTALPPTAASFAAQLALPLGDSEGELDNADEAPDIASLLPHDPARERRWLEGLGRAARAAGAHETKLAAIKRLLERIAEPVLLFTEYRDTLLHVQQALARPCGVLHGGMNRRERATTLAEFAAGAFHVLLATDAAGEGLNLQHCCRLVINLELPWNPVRLEQRIGRVDRIGQTRNVHAVNLVARETGEERILARLRTRAARAEADLRFGSQAGHIDDRQTMEFLATGIDRSAGNIAADEDVPPPELVAIHLKGDAAAEVVRVADMRRLSTASAVGVSSTRDRVLLTFARSRKTRAAVPHDLLLIFRLACEDGNGQTVESTLMGASVDCSAAINDRAAVERLLGAGLTRVASRMEAATDWYQRARSIAREFAGCRLTRERAINARTGGGTDIVQAGLFDRRAERQRLADRAVASEDAADRDRRIRILEQSSRVTNIAPELILVLAP